MALFGLKLPRLSKKEDPRSSFVPPTTEDGAQDIISTEDGPLTMGGTGHYIHTINMDNTARNLKDLIEKYREMARHPEGKEAIQDIINEAIVVDGKRPPVEINLEDVEMSESIKKKVRNEFSEIMKMLSFKRKGQQLFRKWYVDGRLYFHLIVDPKSIKKGVTELRAIDPRYISKIRKITKNKNPATNIETITKIEEFYKFEQPQSFTPGTGMAAQKQVLLIAPEAISYTHSGLYDDKKNLVLSYLHPAIKPMNQLRMLEDSVVIYRLARAPERRIFYIDVGNMPRNKAQQFLRDQMSRYKNKLVYDATTGELKDERRIMSMMEDFWLPRREGGKGTEISTLPGGCLSMDTKVSLLDGRELSISDIHDEMETGKQLWTYSCSPEGEVVPGLISWAGVTQKSAEVLKLTLDNGEEIICTPDHKFPVYEKGQVRADALEIGESMIPLYRKKKEIADSTKLDYEQVFDNKTKKWVYTHRLVADYLRDTVVRPFTYDEQHSEKNHKVRHHIDRNRFNNDPNNLCFMAWRDHGALHSYILQTWLNSLNQTDYEELCQKKSLGILRYLENLTQEERTKRAQTSKTNAKKGSDRVQLLLKEPEYKKWFYEQVRLGWTPEKRQSRSQEISKRNLKNWNNPTTAAHLRKQHQETQKLVFSHDMLMFVIDLIKDKTPHEFTIHDVTEELNSSEKLVSQLTELNQTKNVPNWSVEDGFSSTIVKKLVKQFDYDSWVDFRTKAGVHNHRIVKIEKMEKPIEVGTLTIDKEEKYHGHHTFALKAGVFTLNSNLGEIEDVIYFQKKLYKALNVPVSRLEAENAFNLGRASEITRDELRFTRFIGELRTNFSELFLGILKTQLILKNIIREDEWKDLLNDIHFDFENDAQFTQLKNLEIIQNQFAVLRDATEYVGEDGGGYLSKTWVRSKILGQTEEEAKIIKKQIEKEASIGDDENVAGINTPPDVNIDPMTGQPAGLPIPTLGPGGNTGAPAPSPSKSEPDNTSTAPGEPKAGVPKSSTPNKPEKKNGNTPKDKK